MHCLKCCQAIMHSLINAEYAGTKIMTTSLFDLMALPPKTRSDNVQNINLSIFGMPKCVHICGIISERNY